MLYKVHTGNIIMNRGGSGRTELQYFVRYFLSSPVAEFIDPVRELQNGDKGELIAHVNTPPPPVTSTLKLALTPVQDL
jgi:hypothetical protein